MVEEFSEEIRKYADIRAKLFEEDQMFDWFLAELVHYVNRGWPSIDVDLTVGGSVISGRLISGAEYFAATAKNFHFCYEHHLEKVTPNDLHNIVDKTAELVDLFSGRCKKIVEVNYSDEAILASKKFDMFIHMSHVSHNGVAPHDNMLWRGKLSAVEGYSFNRFARPERP